MAYTSGKRTEPAARTSDPSTSHAAAVRAKQFVWDHKTAILGALWKPMHCYRLAKLTNLTHVQVDRRMRELANAGLVQDTGRTEMGEAGTPCILWEKVLDKGTGG